MIVTAKPRVPFSWLMLALLPWGALMLKGYVMGQAFTFSLMKFIENPAGLAFILSLPAIVSLVVAPITNFMADRVWTRFGRRKPFIVVSWVGVISMLTAMPFMPNFWLLLACYLLYSFFNDLGGPVEQLKLEVVPPPQRGTSTTISTWIFNLVNMLWAFVAIGRFDDQTFMAGVPIAGETSLYWSVASVMTVMLCLVMLGIKETNPHSLLRGQRLTIRTFVGGILSAHLWPVYLLVFAYAIFNAGLGVLGTLLMIEQWGFTIQDQGTNIAVGSTLNIFLILGMLLIADRMDRLVWLPRLMAAAIVVNISYYLYIETVLYDGIPTLVEIICFGETLSIIGMLIGLIYTPLVYDFVARNEMGTYMAGSSLVGKLTGVITLNGIGLFAWIYASLWMPPGGEMVRVVLAQDTTAEALRPALAAATWTDPATNTSVGADQVSARVWYATNAQLDHGRGLEVRLRNDRSVADRKHREALAADKAKLDAQLANAKALGQTDKIPALEAAIRPLATEIAEIDATLDRRAQAFRDQVVAALGPQLVTEGGGFLDAEAVNATVVELPLVQRPSGTAVERLLEDLRASHPSVIDLRPQGHAGAYHLELSTVTGTEDDLLKDLAPFLTKRLGAAAPAIPSFRNQRPITGVAMTVRIVEDPLDRHLSPINRVWQGLTGSFLDHPGPERRIGALGRALRTPGTYDHTRITAIDEATIRVVALRLGPTPAPLGTAPTPPAHLASLPAALLPLATGLEEALVRVGATQRITVARPVVTQAFAPLRYDYMAGYLWMLALQVVGLVIILAFIRKVRDGRIRRRGIEEMEATAHP